MDTFSNRLRIAMDRRNMTASELSKKSGISNSSISEWLKGKYVAKQDKVYSLGQALNVDEAWLMGFDNVDMDKKHSLNDMYKELNHDNKRKAYNYVNDLWQSQVEESFTLHDYTDVVLSGYVAAGTGNYVDDVQETVSIPTSYLPKGNYDVMVKVSGDSMEPAFQDGDYIFIKHVDEFPNGKFAVVIVNNEAYLKKVYKDDGKLRLVSLNDKYSDMYFDETDDIKIVGTVVN